MCGKGSNTQTSTTTSGPTPEALAGYQSLFSRAQGVADTPYNPATQQQVAGFTSPQYQAFGNVESQQGAYQPYLGQATSFATAGGSPISAGAIQNYINPWTQNVVDTTMADFATQNARQLSGVTGNARINGSWGGDREAVAQALTAEAQNRTQAPIIANLRSQGYTQALGAAQQDAARAQTAAGQFANLGGLAQQYGYTDINALLQSGAIQQGQQQKVLDAATANASAQAAYPFQTTQWLAGIEGALGPAMGTTSTGAQTGAKPNTWTQAAGLGLAALSFLNRGGRVDERKGYADGGAPTLAGMPYAAAPRYVPDTANLNFGSMLRSMGQQGGSGGQGQPSMASTYGDVMSNARAFQDAGNGLSNGFGRLAEWGSSTATPDGLGGSWSTSTSPSGFSGWGNFLSGLASGGRVKGFAGGGDVAYDDAVSPASAFLMDAGARLPPDGGAVAGLFPQSESLPAPAPNQGGQQIAADFSGAGGFAANPEQIGFGFGSPSPMAQPMYLGGPQPETTIQDRPTAGVAYGAAPAPAPQPSPAASFGAPPAPAPASGSQGKGFGGWLQDTFGIEMTPAMRQGLLAAGLGMMSSDRGGPGSFGINIGRGGLAGLQAYNQARMMEPEIALKNVQLESARDVLAATRALRTDLSQPSMATPQVGRQMTPNLGMSAAPQATHQDAAHAATVAQSAPYVASVRETPQGAVAYSANDQPLFNIANEYAIARRMTASGVKEFVSAGETHMKLIQALLEHGMQPTASGGAMAIPGAAEVEARKAAMKTGAEAQASAPYKILEAAAQQGARPMAVHPGETVTTGAQINPALQGAIEWASRRMPGGASPGPASVPGIQGQAPAPAAPQAAPQQAAPAPSPAHAPIFPMGLQRNADGSLSTRQTPEDIELQKHSAKEFEGAQDAYKTGSQVLQRLTGMEHAIDQLNAPGRGWLTTGWGADTRFAIAKAGNGVAQAVGANPVFDPNAIADWEKLTKDTNNLGFSLARTLGAREAASVVSNAVASVPGAANSPLGAKMVLSSIRQGVQRDVDYYEFAHHYRQENRTLVGADVAFNKLHPPESYAQRAIDESYASFFKIKPEALAYLRAHPDTRAQFDAAYGIPALGISNPSNAILGRGGH